MAPVALAQFSMGQRGGEVEGRGFVSVTGDGAGDGAREMVAEFADGDAKAVNDLCIYALCQEEHAFLRGENNNMQGAREMETGCTYNRTDRQKPHHHHDRLRQPRRILSLNTIHRHPSKELHTDIQIKHRTDADRTKEAHKERLLLLLDLLDSPVHGVDDGDTAEKEDEDAEEDEAVDGDDVVVDEGGPGADGAEPHEDGEVEEHVDRRLQGVVEGFEAEPVAVGMLEGEEGRWWE